MNAFFLILLNCTWGIVQNIVGGIMFLCNFHAANADDTHRGFFHKGTCVSSWKKRAGLSMGLFIFLPIAEENTEERPDTGNRAAAFSERLLRHEYGHSIQSAILGPFYLPIIGLSSWLWCNDKRIGRRWRSHEVSYFDAFQEKWADRLGKV